MGKVVERIVNAERVEDLITVFGSFDENIKRIEDALTVRVVNRGTDLRVSGDEEMADKAVRTLEGLLSLAAKGETIDEQRVRYLITLVNEGNDAQVAQMAKDVVCITAKGKPIKAKTVGQQNYMKAIMKNTITIYGSRIAYGNVTFIVSTGLLAQTLMFEGTTVALLDMQISYQEPVRFEDTIYCKFIPVEKRPTKTPGRGLITFHVFVYNQNDEQVAEERLVLLISSEKGHI